MNNEQQAQRLKNFEEVEQEVSMLKGMLKSIIPYLPKSNESNNHCRCPCCTAVRYVENL